MAENMLTKIVSARQQLVEAQTHLEITERELQKAQHKYDEARRKWETTLFEFDNRYKVE